MGACGFRFYADISASKVMEYPRGLRTDTPEKRGAHAQTFHFYLQAVTQFRRWTVKDPRVIESLVAYLDGLNVKTDWRHRSWSCPSRRRSFTCTGLILKQPIFHTAVTREVWRISIPCGTRSSATLRQAVASENRPGAGAAFRYHVDDEPPLAQLPVAENQRPAQAAGPVEIIAANVTGYRHGRLQGGRSAFGALLGAKRAAQVVRRRRR